MNVCRNRRQSRRRRQAVEILRDPQTLEAIPASPSARSEELAGLVEALASMTKPQRQAILLREWKGLSYHEIAAELGLSRPAVETLLFRARRSLASLLVAPADPGRRQRLGGFGFGFGSVAAAMKSLAGGGSAAKLAATVAVVATVVATGSVVRDSNPPASTDSGNPPSHVTPRSQNVALPSGPAGHLGPYEPATISPVPPDRPPPTAVDTDASEPAGPASVPPPVAGDDGTSDPTTPSASTPVAPHDATVVDDPIAQPQPSRADPPQLPLPSDVELPPLPSDVELPPLPSEVELPPVPDIPALPPAPLPELPSVEVPELPIPPGLGLAR